MTRKRREAIDILNRGIITIDKCIHNLTKRQCQTRELVMYDLNDCEVNVYKNMTIASNETGISYSKINKVISGIQKQADGYKFKWRAI